MTDDRDECRPTVCLLLMGDSGGDANATWVVQAQEWRDGHLTGLYAEVVIRVEDRVANVPTGKASGLRAGDYVMCRRAKESQSTESIYGPRALWEPVLLCPVVPVIQESK